METVVALPGRDELRNFVRLKLCDEYRLDPDFTPFFEAVVSRRGRTCGLYFEIHGPRLLRAFAIWAGEEHRILFYDSVGERFAEVRLSDAPDPLRLIDDPPTPQAA
ncbi:MAG: hypothetical protein ACJ8F7_16765 [Gemmataceae bacterium]